MANTNQAALARRRLRVRNRLKKVATGRPRLSVFRSGRNIYAQVIDDKQSRTVAAASTLDKSLSLKGVATVEGKVAASAELMFTFKDIEA